MCVCVCVCVCVSVCVRVRACVCMCLGGCRSVSYLAFLACQVKGTVGV